MAETEPGLQPLRIPGGWKVDMNALYELEPAPENIDWFYGSILFSAICSSLRKKATAFWKIIWSKSCGCANVHSC